MMKKKSKRPWGVFIAIALAIVFGTLVGDSREIFGIKIFSILDVIGILFLNALTLVVVPLVSSSIIVGISRIGGEEGFKRIGAKMFSFYIGTTLLAILIGLLFVNLIGPGYQFGSVPTADIANLSKELNTSSSSILNVLLSIIPANIVNALSQGNMLGLIFFSGFFGFCISKIEEHNRATLRSFFTGLFQVMIQFTHLIMKFLPIGVFCLVAKVFMTTGLESLASVALFTLTVLLGLVAFMFVGLPLLVKTLAKVSPIRLFKAMSPALITAFSTSSSSATIPVTIDCVEKRAGVSNRICSLVVPLGTSMNMSGSALYECVAAMFVAQAYGIELTMMKQFLIVVLALITSIGVAGIPSASLVAVLLILKVIGLPLEGIGLFIAVDRILDMCRTTVNVFSDSCCAVLVAKSEGEKNVLTSDEY
ncbi:MAG TPA: dicarboxylate/amino acid:cation symporter [Chlamydiales bacterium]|nr:dicarboxylate/amino acid:cation symporter [Chlamydiales bacterium]